MVTSAQILKFAPKAKPELVEAIVAGWSKAEAAKINTSRRIRHFLANIAVETAGLQVLSENMNYTTASRIRETWPSRFPTIEHAREYVRQPKLLAIKVYGGRMGNKPYPSDDGWIYRGGGALQTTGRDGYRKMGFEKNPDDLRKPEIAFETAVREWANRGCNAPADRDDAKGVRQKINGGIHGLKTVRAFLNVAKKIWPDDAAYVPAKVVTPEPEPKLVPIAEETIRFVQRRLRELGYVEVGRADCQLGQLTRTAILAFRMDNHLALVPEIDAQLMGAMAGARPRKLARANASPQEIRRFVPEVKANFLGKILSGIAAGFSSVAAAFAGVMEGLPSAKEYLEPLKEFAGNVPGWVWIGLIGAVALSTFLINRSGEKTGIEAFKKGARR